MRAATVTKFKFFFAHQDREQEEWLRAMARQGLHLKSVNVLCFWTFVKGTPADVVYRVDFHNSRVDDYRRLFEDAGWERAAEVTGWQYWRKAVVDGREPEIHTDRQSKIAKFQRVLGFLAVSVMPITVIMLTSNKKDFLDKWPTSVVVFLAVMVPIYIYIVLALFLRIRAVRNEG